MRPPMPEPRLPDPQFRSAPLPSRAAAAAKKIRLIVRNDGVVFEFSKNLIKRNDYRLYTGPWPANIEQVREWLYGEGGEVPPEDTENEAFDIEKATKGQLLIHAQQQYGKDISRHLSVGDVREEVRALIEAHAP